MTLWQAFRYYFLGFPYESSDSNTGALAKSASNPTKNPPVNKTTETTPDLVTGSSDAANCHTMKPENAVKDESITVNTYLRILGAGLLILFPLDCALALSITLRNVAAETIKDITSFAVFIIGISCFVGWLAIRLDEIRYQAMGRLSNNELRTPNSGH